MNPANVQAAFAATLVDEWHRAGVTHAVVAPGSRSTPILAALQADGRLRLHVVIDERSACFMALGIGMATGVPALVVTTSGTAAAELHPGVVEAHQAGVPLLAVTADRPPELHGVGAPQTIDQEQLFAGALRYFAAPGVPEAGGRGWWRSLAARAAAEAVAGPRGPGPVHLNLAFREPLLASDKAAAGRLVPEGRPAGRPWHQVTRPPGEATGGAAGVLTDLAGAGERGLIVAGAGAGHPDPIWRLAAATGWPVLADPRSGARWPRAGVVAAADSLLRVPAVAAWEPDVVVRLGRPWASRVVAEWLASRARAYQVLVDRWGEWGDPERRADAVVAADPGWFCAALAGAVDNDRSAGAGGGGAVADRGGWGRAWAAAEAAAQSAIDGALATRPVLSEPALARRLVAALPSGATLVTSSSMPVRDVEWFAAPRRAVRFLANRGANGIDGVVSTAMGVAAARRSPTYALVGDLAFFYDAGALLGAGGRPLDLTLVVVDNSGGGIFSFLPQAAALPRQQFEQLWGTPPGADPAAVAEAYGARVVAAPDGDAVARAVATAPAGVTVVVARVADRHANVAAHQAVNDAVAAAVAAAVAPGVAGGVSRRRGG